MSVSPTMSANVTIPPKRAYVYGEFVGRSDELKEVDKRVAQGKQEDKIDRPVLNFWGIEGCGKSWLVRHIAHRYRGPGQLRKGERRRTFTILLDFASFDSFEWTPQHLAMLLRPAIQDTVKQLTAVPHETATLLERVGAAEKGDGQAEDLVQCFVEWIAGLADAWLPIVLFDTIERVAAEVLSQVELYFIEPLASTDAVIIITAGRRQVARWRRFAVRNRQDDPVELKPFSPQDTHSQLHKQGFELPGEFVHRYSFGLAYVSQVIADAINQLAQGRKVGKRFLQKNEGSLIPWLAGLENHLLQAVHPPSVRDELRALCVLRVIREGVLTDLLPSKANGERRELLDKLEEIPLIWWDSDRGAYLMPLPLRRLMSMRLQLQEPDAFSEYHSRAAEYYKRTVRKNPYDCGSSLVEALYHTALAYQDSDQLSGKVKELLDDVLQTDNFTVGGAEFLLRRLFEDAELHAALPTRLVKRAIKSAQGLLKDVQEMRLSKD